MSKERVVQWLRGKKIRESAFLESVVKCDNIFFKALVTYLFKIAFFPTD